MFSTYSPLHYIYTSVLRSGDRDRNYEVKIEESDKLCRLTIYDVNKGDHDSKRWEVRSLHILSSTIFKLYFMQTPTDARCRLKSKLKTASEGAVVAGGSDKSSQ